MYYIRELVRVILVGVFDTGQGTEIFLKKDELNKREHNRFVNPIWKELYVLLAAQ